VAYLVHARTETLSRDYATVGEAVLSLCQAELCRAVPCLASSRLSLSDKCKRLDRATVRMGHMTSASAVTSRVSAVQWYWDRVIK
jgi:hypothetical protein